MDNAIVKTIRSRVLAGFEKDAGNFPVSGEIPASPVSWAVFGSAIEWAETHGREPAHKIVPELVRLNVPAIKVGGGRKHAATGERT